jgi:O-antigen/teichoic acid export membrane protein
MSTVLKTWLPLVASWLLMSIELPTINAIVARLENAEVNLAAYGGVVFPIALTIEAPVIMLLAASTALSRDWRSYQKLKKLTLWLGGSLMALHLIVALTPIYDFIVRVLLQSPEAVIEPARVGLILLAPWSFAIAYRRFQQGAMIRFGHSNMVGQTTLVRLITVSVVLTIGFILKTIPGTLLAGLAQGLGVTAEAIYAGLRIRKILPDIKAAPPTEKSLSLKRFLSFYLPLALTSSLWLLWQPLISGAVSRMPQALESLAVWSVVTGLLFMIRSPGVAYNEAVVALLEEKRSYPVLRKFARIAALVTTGIALVFVLTPLSRWWLSIFANLSPDKVEIASMTLVLGLPLGFLSVYISLYQGIIVNREKTGAVAEAVVVFLIFLGVILVTGVVTQSFKGVYIASASFTAAHLTQGLWLYLRSRKLRKSLVDEL